MDLLIKKKKIFILYIILIIIILSGIVTLFSLKDREEQGNFIEGTIIERMDNYLYICNEKGEEYHISLEANYKGISLDTLREGDLVKVWYKGEIAETYPMQITAYKIEKK